MSEIRVTQVETLIQCKVLYQFQDAKFSMLRASMDLLASQIHDSKSGTKYFLGSSNRACKGS